jgi:hypothetical protein
MGRQRQTGRQNDFTHLIFELSQAGQVDNALQGLDPK